MRKLIICLIFSLMLLCNILAKGSAGSSSGDILLIHSNASINASGNAGVGIKNPNWQFIQFNPAYLNILNQNVIGFSHNEYIESISQNSLSLIYNISNYNIYFELSNFNYGSFDRRTYYSSEDGTLGSFNPRSTVLKSYVAFKKFLNIQTGIGIKYFNERLDAYSADAILFDFGGIYLFNSYPASIGFSVMNIGSKVQYNKISENLPFTLRFGGSYYLFENKLGLIFDIEKVRNEDINIFTGLHYRFLPAISFRAGIDGANDDLKGLGLGFDYQPFDQMEISYAFIPYDNFDVSHKFTLSYYFGDIYHTDKRKKVISKTLTDKERYLKYLREGNHYFSTGKYINAIKKYYDAIDIIDDDDLVYYNLSVLYYNIENNNRALIFIDKALYLNPRSIDNNLLKFYILIKLNDLKSLREFSEKLYNANLNHPILNEYIYNYLY